MRIDGRWYLCDDGAIRPVIGGKIQAADASYFAAEFLVDTGADRTVHAAATLQALRLPHVRVEERLEGVGGRREAVVVETRLRFATSGSRTYFSAADLRPRLTIQPSTCVSSDATSPIFSHSSSTGRATSSAFSASDTPTSSPMGDTARLRRPRPLTAHRRQRTIASGRPPGPRAVDLTAIGEAPP